jgi:hypothetical protein
MCQRLGELREALGHYAAGFDAGLISPGHAARVVDHAAAVEKMAATLKALAAARVAETGLWRQGGDRSPAHELARRTGTHVGDAARALGTGKALKDLADTQAAAKRGELSAEQAAAIADAVSADPSSEAKLLDKARRACLKELKDECARTKAAACPDPEAKRRRIHQGRYLRSYTDSEGAFNLHFKNNPEVGAEVMAALEPIRDRLFRKARSEGRREPLEPTPPTPWWSWPGAADGRQTTTPPGPAGTRSGPAPRSWSGSTSTPCCGATPSKMRQPRSQGLGRWRCQPSPISWPPAAPFWPRW